MGKEGSIGIYYERSAQYRTVHADGVWVGVTPQGAVQFAVFSDLRPIPDFARHKLTADNELGEVIEQAVKDGMVRETEVNIVMSIPLAEQFISLLNKAIKSLQEAIEQQKSASPPQD